MPAEGAIKVLNCHVYRSRDSAPDDMDLFGEMPHQVIVDAVLKESANAIKGSLKRKYSEAELETRMKDSRGYAIKAECAHKARKKTIMQQAGPSPRERLRN